LTKSYNNQKTGKAAMTLTFPKKSDFTMPNLKLSYIALL